MKIGLVPGAMKPYHAGHHYLTRQALAECDQIIIITSLKDRKTIKGENMKKIWENLIIPRMPKNVQVRFVTSPVGEVYKIIEEANSRCSSDEYRIYGGTEDVARFPTAKLRLKYSSITGKIINVAEERSNAFVRGKGASPVAKGQWVRDAIANQDFVSFERMLPNFLKSASRDYLEMLTK